jgi:hypothetical protein
MSDRKPSAFIRDILNLKWDFMSERDFLEPTRLNEQQLEMLGLFKIKGLDVDAYLHSKQQHAAY